MHVVSVVVDSRDRDSALHPRPHTYVARLNDEVKDVASLELRQAIYSSSHASSHAYACVVVEEARPIQLATNTRVAESCALLHLERPFIDRQTFAVQVPVVSSRISKLTIRIVGPNGEPIDLGEHLLRFDLHIRPEERSPPKAPTTPERESNHDLESWARAILGIQGRYRKSDLKRAFYAVHDGSDPPKVAYKVLRALV